jgi:hypothetical protein
MEEPHDLDQLTREIRRNIEENRKFLERVLEEDFEPQEDEAGTEEEEFEEL